MKQSRFTEERIIAILREHEAGAATLKGLRATFGLDEAALASVEALAIDDAGGGPVIARFRQRDQARGLDVFRGGLAIAMSRRWPGGDATYDPVSASGFLAFLKN